MAQSRHSGKKKIRAFRDNFGELQKKISLIRFFFHENMEGKPVYEIEKAYLQLEFALKKGGMNASIDGGE